MFKLLCLFAVIAAVSAMPRVPEWPAPGQASAEKVQQPFHQLMQNNPQHNKQQGVTLTAGDDMDKAESFGFGYHRYYSYPAYYYPTYYYGYYPSYYYGYYW
ncbi:uncharacterized protein LOC121594079 [Anopheles merus]|uniref:uncharacterized protein LOC121594079 n=1 Tax=Anopheles merus TaxID=30066 RepID=UPI001BE40A5F|nr:uncharacterized protein LOC121594079 [Anopheles merus]